jgi:hypothetical protein
MKRNILLLFLILIVALGATYRVLIKRCHPPLTPAVATAALEEAAAHPERPTAARPLIEALRSELVIHRKLIVLFADEVHLKGPARETALHLGHQLHHDDRAMVFQLDNALATLAAKPSSQRDPVIAALLEWMERDPEVMELDRLAFRDPLRVLQHSLTKDQSAEGLALKARIAKDLAEVDRVEALVEAEYRQVFGGPGAAAKGGERKHWNDYVNALKRLFPAAEAKAATSAPTLKGSFEISGR